MSTLPNEEGETSAPSMVTVKFLIKYPSSSQRSILTDFTPSERSISNSKLPSEKGTVVFLSSLMPSPVSR